MDALLVKTFRKLVHLKVQPVWPFGARDTPLDISGYDVLDQHCVVVYGQTFESAKDVGIVAPEVRNKKNLLGYFIH
jgi:hypothetical protein